jgi:hypothetical protein
VQNHGAGPDFAKKPQISPWHMAKSTIFTPSPGIKNKINGHKDNTAQFRLIDLRRQRKLGFRSSMVHQM